MTDILNEIFERELQQAKCACCVSPGGSEVCCVDPVNKVVYVGEALSPASRAIVGLHELGHMATLQHYYMLQPTPATSYAAELSAWAWAESRIAHVPEAIPLLYAWRSFALLTYYYVPGGTTQ